MRFLEKCLLALTLIACADSPKEARDMPIGPITPGSYVVVTPDINPLPYTQVQAPTATMPVISADVQALALEILNVQNSVVVFANLHTLAPQTDGGKVYVSGMGWYTYTQSTPFTADGTWVVTCDIGGQFVHELVALHNLAKIAAIGPVPGEAFTVATPAGRINKQFITQGFFTQAFNTYSQYNTTSGSAVTLATLHNLGPLQVDDVISFRANITAHGNSTANFSFQVWVEQSQDNGGTWTDMTNQGGASYRGTTNNANEQVAIAANYESLQVVNNTTIIRLRAASDGTNQVVVDMNSSRAWVTRP